MHAQLNLDCCRNKCSCYRKTRRYNIVICASHARRRSPATRTMTAELSETRHQGWSIHAVTSRLLWRSVMQSVSWHRKWTSSFSLFPLQSVAPGRLVDWQCQRRQLRLVQTRVTSHDRLQHASKLDSPSNMHTLLICDRRNSCLRETWTVSL